jgi:hypothetical protein
LKLNTRKATARAGNWEIYSNRGLGRAKARERKRAGFDLARTGTRLSLRLNPAEPGLVRSPRSRQAEAPFPPHRSRRSTPEASAQAGDYRNPHLRIRVIVVSSKEEPSHHNGVKQKMLARWQKHTVKRDIHTANDEEQVKICMKLKRFLAIRLVVT